MELGGTWRALMADDRARRSMPDVDLDDTGWDTLEVPGHWRSHPNLADSDGPVFYRRRFESPRPGADRRAWLHFDGMFYQSDVWLDGSYLGDTEGYFFTHTFEVTEALRQRDEHLLAVELTCAKPDDYGSKRNLTGVFQHWGCIDPSWNPGGIWAPVRLSETGALRISDMRVTCRDATPELASLDVEVRIDAAEAATALLTTYVVAPTGEIAAERTAIETVAAGDNRVNWRMGIENPMLWWPHSMGAQPLYEVRVSVGTDRDASSDSRRVQTGLRQVRMRDFVATVNGERLFVKGASYGPSRRELAEVSAELVASDIATALDTGLDLLRVHGHVAHPHLYEGADRAGLLLWQDMPLQWGYANVRRQAIRQAAEAVSLLGHHPSILLWCAHSEPVAWTAEPGPAGRGAFRASLAQALPGWNKSGLDRSIRRAIEKADGSRPVVAHSGVYPHPVAGTDSQLGLGWYRGDVRDLPTVTARLPVLARFVSGFGAQAVPASDAWIDSGNWPDLDWDDLVDHHGLERDVFDQRVPAGRHSDFSAWREATQGYQAEVVRFHVEHLRCLKFRPTGGFCQFLLADAQPAISHALVDHERRPKAALAALKAACAPVIVVAERPPACYRQGQRLRLGVYVVSDSRTPLDNAVVTARAEWPGGEHTWRFAGQVAADACARVGSLDADLPGGRGPIVIELALRWDGGGTSNRYESWLADD